ncbi:MAG: hypothetical protein HGA96_13195 [Desulfobulbaceae bacterium]|nr:hypothetical protein [Desulfobulbaceae bacterium]
MKKTTAALFLAIHTTTLLAAIPVGAGQECAEKVLATCTKCHSQARICEKLEKNSRRDWQTTIKRMLRYGLIGSDSEQENLLTCLTGLAKDNGKLCQ